MSALADVLEIFSLFYLVSGFAVLESLQRRFRRDLYHLGILYEMLKGRAILMFLLVVALTVANQLSQKKAFKGIDLKVLD
ncbi:hypothetical protein Y032_0185g1043 [Ancylostoma ceylanicum]|uniref:Uncharacterized protein n=1 Tax=Ancylostoma ceylanicum TaxID=53326 RepID=A0A016SS60_9BILA|nr:hypothetical protein Y032_0185g1043 [Ancylostoma ceylanicum]